VRALRDGVGRLGVVAAEEAAPSVAALAVVGVEQREAEAEAAAAGVDPVLLDGVTFIVASLLDGRSRLSELISFLGLSAPAEAVVVALAAALLGEEGAELLCEESPCASADAILPKRRLRISSLLSVMGVALSTVSVPAVPAAAGEAAASPPGPEPGEAGSASSPLSKKLKKLIFRYASFRYL